MEIDNTGKGLEGGQDIGDRMWGFGGRWGEGVDGRWRGAEWPRMPVLVPAYYMGTAPLPIWEDACGRLAPFPPQRERKRMIDLMV